MDFKSGTKKVKELFGSALQRVSQKDFYKKIKHFYAGKKEKNMDLKGLSKQISLILKLHPELKNTDVVVNLNRLGIGSGAQESIKSASIGMDWDKGKFILYPTKALIYKKKNRDIIIKSVKKGFKGFCFPKHFKKVICFNIL
jgi:hypothetical protein